MKTYHFASIHSYEKRFYFTCTDPKFIYSLMEQLKKINSDFVIESQTNDLMGELCQIELQFKSSKISDQARYWFQKQLCKQGWEPLDYDKYKIEVETS